jgi:hypothetical protein
VRITSIIILLIVFTIDAFGQNKATIAFEETIVKFPKAQGGDVLNFSYPFTNTGTVPLIIQNIKVACTCTKPLWPKHPIMPGSSDSITVEFDTKKVWGWQEKELRIYSNASDAYTSVYFKGNVKKGEYVKKEQEKK